MSEYAAMLGQAKHQQAFSCIATEMNKALQESMKRDEVVCLMTDDPDNLGTALVCSFLLSETNLNQRKQYSASKAMELLKERRIQAQIIR